MITTYCRSVLRWLTLPACLLAAVMTVQTITSRVRAAREAEVLQLGRDLRVYATELERQVGASALRDCAEVESMLERFRGENHLRIAWILLRDGKGTVVASAGRDPDSPFAVQVLRSRLRSGKALYAVRQTGAGKVVVAAFALHTPDRSKRLRTRLVSADGGASGSEQWIVEIAGYVQTTKINPPTSSREPVRFAA